MHHAYCVIESLPHFVIGDAKTEIQWTMRTGHPVQWNEAWAKLAWMHPRAHAPRRESSTPPSAAAPLETFDCHTTPPSSTTLPLALDNGVTGRNNPRKDREHAAKGISREKAVAALPEHASQVTTGQLVFISVEIESAEGELAIGLARAMHNYEVGEGEFMWYVRKEWIKKPHRFEWSKNPTFEVAADPDDPSKPYVTKEQLCKVLPIAVALTEGCKKNCPRIDAACVRMLRTLCAQRGLLQMQPKPQQEDGASRNEDATSSDDEVAKHDHLSRPGVDELISHRVQSRKRVRSQVIYEESE